MCVKLKNACSTCTTNKLTLLKSEILKIIQFQQATKNQSKLQNQNHNLFSQKQKFIQPTGKTIPIKSVQKGGRQNSPNEGKVKANHKKKYHTKKNTKRSQSTTHNTQHENNHCHISTSIDVNQCCESPYTYWSLQI